MSKLVIAVMLSVLLGGTVLYVVGGQLVPAATVSGGKTRVQIQNAFQ
ncbi:hypothetical protein [Paenibacillus sp. YYML68]|nr:hypothetical protein [Paenibacillus sp. YYML68]